MYSLLPCHLLLLSVQVSVTHGRQYEAQGISNVALFKGIGAVPSLREREKEERQDEDVKSSGGGDRVGLV